MSEILPLMMNSIIPVKGVSFYQDAVARLRIGDVVNVSHDPKNPYDANACVVKTLEDETIGHVPAELAPRLLATGSRQWQGVVVELIDHTLRAVRIKITPKEIDYDLLATTLTGRILGTWVSTEGDSVAILNKDGERVLYPKSQVRCQKVAV